VKFDLLLKNGLIVTEAGSFTGGIAVKEGKIAELFRVEEGVQAEKVIDAKGLVILPGLVDGHAHFNEPGREHWEGYKTGSMAAAAGGVTTVLDMPLNATPPTINHAHLLEKRRVVANQSVVDYGHWGGFVDNNLAELEAMNADGVIGYKAFASNSGVDFARINDDLIYAGLVEMKRLGNLIGLHAENEWVTTYLADQLKKSGRIDRAVWPESRPPATELETVQRACFWAGVAGGNLHIVHVSIAEGIQAITQARRAGSQVTSETCPHYLFFDESDFEKIGPAAKCAPPIRSRDNVEKLWNEVLGGHVDTIGSDHSPCNWEEKQKGMENIWQAWGGISGIQSMLPVLLTEGYHKRRLPLELLVKMTSSNPARLFGLYPQKGAIVPGADADLVLVDLEKEWTLTADDLFYKNKHSAYVGRKFKGKVISTVVRGEVVFDKEQIQAQPGYGKLLKRQYPYRYERG
jgi:allantoinase